MGKEGKETLEIYQWKHRLVDVPRNMEKIRRRRKEESDRRPSLRLAYARAILRYVYVTAAD